VPLFLKQREDGKVTVTDPRMTRFWLTVDQGVRFVIRCLEVMQGGEVFVPKIPSMSVQEVAKTLAPGCRVDYTGIRPGEKLHEVLISEDEARNSVDTGEMFVVRPPRPWYFHQHWEGQALAEGFRYTSETNGDWLDAEQFLGLSTQNGSYNCVAASKS
jgi:UDP-N-acetylglucosamine 4,6-dehydratase